MFTNETRFVDRRYELARDIFLAWASSTETNCQCSRAAKAQQVADAVEWADALLAALDEPETEAKP